ncbi:MAG TPA: methyltransferase domain-containing protein [Gaiellaceae bacterium]|nr:methyltransferase domain-containing protein [Gaiellaceae bacterium]
MTIGQRFARLATTVVVRAPAAWRLFRRPLTRAFDRLAPTWETRISDERLRPILAALDALPEPPRRVLDVGTGTGRVARVAAERWPEAEVVGADVSPGMIEEARRLGGRVQYDVADAATLPYGDASFDLLALNNMIPFFDELARVTAPGGHVVVAFTMGDKTPIYVPPDRIRSELGRRGFLHVAEFEEGGAGPACAQGRPVVTSGAQGRSRRGSTGPDVSFLRAARGYTAAARRGSSVGRAHG